MLIYLMKRLVARVTTLYKDVMAITRAVIHQTARTCDAAAAPLGRP
jgi:hypothetical protein